jgi:predicted Kef-type K+ transport protein
MEFIWLLFAFACGLAAKSISLPPSIGYLLAGFLLNFIGLEANENLQLLADLGITLMLFTIGLKLNIKDLFKNEIWLGSLSHTSLWLVVGVAIFKLAAIATLPYFSDLTLTTSALIVFALSFSSTVCIVKLLEEQGEMKTRHGKLAIGVLVIQDIIAVGFLVLATGKIPSFWAVALLGLLLIRPLIFKLISKAGHGELLPLSGFFLAFGGYALFELVNIKGDLGALLIGMFFAPHIKAAEISKSLMSFKDIFLIGFFLSIGFVALPTFEMLNLAILLVVILIPVKFLLFFTLFSSLKLRCRTSYLTALALSNFSEFGLIVAALSVKSGWLTEQWLVILAIAVSISFILTSVIYKYAHIIFSNKKAFFKRFERRHILIEDNIIVPNDAPAIIVGMGRVGKGAYRAMAAHSDTKVWAMDAEKKKVDKLIEEGIDAYVGDAEDAYYWEMIDLSQVKLILLAIPFVQDIENISTILRKAKYQGKIAAIARYDDEHAQMQSFGIDKVFNFYTEAGVGFAEESFALIEPEKN